MQLWLFILGLLNCYFISEVVIINSFQYSKLSTDYQSTVISIHLSFLKFSD